MLELHLPDGVLSKLLPNPSEAGLRMLDWLSLLHFEAPPRNDTREGAEFWCSDAEQREWSTERAAVCIKVAILSGFGYKSSLHGFHKCTGSQPLTQPAHERQHLSIRKMTLQAVGLINNI